MKLVLLLLVACAAVWAEEDYYSTKYDSIDIDEILSNARLLRVYINCLLDLGKCNDEGQTLKDVIPEALVTACKKCSEVQRDRTEKVIRHLVKNNKSDWDALVAKYDPDGKYRENYKKYYEKVQE